MRYSVSITLLAFAASLFLSGQALARGDKAYSQEKSGSAQMEQRQGAQQGQQQYSASQVRELQETLNERGFEAGPVDGIFGPKTRQALQEFQQSEGIAATGTPDQETLDSLGIEEQEFFGVSPEFKDEQQKEGKDQRQLQQERPEQQRQQQQQERPSSERRY